jgi:hypothetical protein
MLSTSTHRRGNLEKRMQSVPFRSVLSVDIEYRGAMPNLKISNRNTIQATGCQNMEVLCAGAPASDAAGGSRRDILAHLVSTYRNRGFDVPEGVTSPVAFVGDIVLANIHFKLGWRVDRTRLRDVMNRERGDFVASYEPLVHDVSVSIKHFEDAPLPGQPPAAPGSGWRLAETTGRCTPCGPRCHTPGAGGGPRCAFTT